MGIYIYIRALLLGLLLVDLTFFPALECNLPMAKKNFKFLRPLEFLRRLSGLVWGWQMK